MTALGTTAHASGRRAVKPAPPPLPTPRWWADVVGGAAILSMVVVTALWVHHGGLQDLGAGFGAGVTAAGRLAGLLAADLLLLQVLGMARIPWAERSFGQDTLARWHRLAGFTSFHLMLAHIVLVTVGYAATSRRAVLRELWDLVANYPGMLLATAATGLLVVVVGLSIRAARRRLRYESWHLIHLYAYLGVGLALPHQLWTGTDFIASPVARLYWWGLYGVVLASVLTFRLGLPAWRSLRHRLEVAAVVPEAPGVVSVHLRGHRLDRLQVRAGQFFVWRFLDGAGWSRGHPYSISAAPHRSMVRITVKDLGDGSGALASVRPGTRAVIEGPYGRLTGEVRTRRRVTMVAAGIGVTPMRALLEELRFAQGEAVLLYRTSTDADVIFRAELDKLARRRGIRVVYLPGTRARQRSWLPGSLGHLTDEAGLRMLVPGIAAHDVFVCGPDPWMDAVREAAVAAGVPPANVHLERFTW